MLLFSDDERLLEKLSQKGNPLARLDSVMNWEKFRPVLNRIFGNTNKGTSKNQLSSIISKKEETLALQFPARVPVFPTFLSLLSGEF